MHSIIDFIKNLYDPVYMQGLIHSGGIPLIAAIVFAETGLLFGFFLPGDTMLFIAGVAGLGARGTKERAAYQRSGMAAIDTMTGRQFEVLLEHFFANKGYRVARIGGRGEFGADLLLVSVALAVLCKHPGPFTSVEKLFGVVAVVIGAGLAVIATCMRDPKDS